MRYLKQMPRLTLLLRLLSITSVASTLSCCEDPSLPVTIQDEHVYVLKGSPLQASSYSQYAVEENFLTSGAQDLTYDQMNQIMDQGYLAGDPYVLMQLSSFEDFNAEIGKLCSNTPCNYSDFQQAMQAFTQKLRSHVQQTPQIR